MMCVDYFSALSVRPEKKKVKNSCSKDMFLLYRNVYAVNKE